MSDAQDGPAAYSVWVCAACHTQCDPDGHWGCPAKGWGGDTTAHGPLVQVVIPESLIEAALDA